jgi:predicted small secreted protein
MRHDVRTQLTFLGGTLKNRATLPAIVLLAAATLTACTDTDGTKDTSSKPSTPATTAAATPSVDHSAAEKAAGIPPVPTGADRARLLRALKVASPGTVRYEDKAIDAARNQCSAINGGAQKLDWSASQRFTYKDVTTTESQGKQINEALKGLGFCKV